MAAKHTKLFHLDWWIIEKRQIYMLLASLVMAGALVAGGVWLVRRGMPWLDTATANTVGTGARFVSLEGDVRIVRGATRETVQATSQTIIYPSDTVQTRSEGRARVVMADGSTLVVRENSTVVIRDNAAEEGKKTNVKVAVDRGQINVRTEEIIPGGRNIVETPKTQNTLGARTNSSFGVNQDASEEIRVSAGRLDSVTREGEKSIVRAGEYVAVNPAGAITRRESLLAPPKLLTPTDFTKIPLGRESLARVPLSWARYGNIGHYRLEVATSPFFVPLSRVLERDRLADTTSNASGLRAGTYFWRVRATTLSGQVSEWSDPLKFIVTAPDNSNERASLTNLKATLVGGNIYLVSGNARPGVTVRCLGRETLATREQNWQLQVTVPPGSRSLSVESREAQGRASVYEVPLSSN
jgi:hypothetical protein